MKFEFVDRLTKKSSNINFHHNPPSRSRVLPCGRTARHNEVNSRFSQFCEKRLKSTQDSYKLTQIKTDRQTDIWLHVLKLQKVKATYKKTGIHFHHKMKCRLNLPNACHNSKLSATVTCLERTQFEPEPGNRIS